MPNGLRPYCRTSVKTKLTVLLLCTLSILPTVTFAQEPKARGPNVKYDRFTDVTSVDTGILQLKSTAVPGYLVMQLLADFDGKEVQKPREIRVLFIAVGPQRQLSKDSELVLLIDGERQRLGIAHHGTRSETQFMEAIGVTLTPTELSHILSGKTIEGKIGPIEFSIDGPSLSEAKAFLASFEQERK